MLVGTLKALFTLDSSKFQAGMKDIQKNLSSTKVKLESTSTSFSKFATRGAASLAVIGFAAVSATKKIGRLVLDIEALNRRMMFATGSMEKGAKAYEFVRKESNRLGVSLEAAAKQYGSLAAAAKGTSMEGEGVMKLFTSIAEIAGVMSLSVYDTHLVFLAFQQMMSKGRIVSEEVRKQLAERMPGAFAMMARSIGVTTEELDKLMATGKLAAEQVLPMFAAQISKELSPAVAELNKSLRVSVSRMHNAWFEMKKMVAESSNLIKTLKTLADVVTFMLGSNVELEAARQAKTKSGTIGGLLFGPAGATGINAEFKKVNDAVKETADVIDNAANKVAAAQAKVNEGFVKFVDTSLRRATDFLIEWATGAEITFKDMATSIIRDMMRIIAQVHIITPLLGAFASSIGGSGAVGSIFGSGAAVSEGGLSSGVSYSGGGGVSASNINVNISALDSKSVTDLMSRNPQAVTGPFIEALQGGDRGLINSMRSNI